MERIAQQRVVFITGASSGVGYALALAFARRGYHVAVTARRADRLAQLNEAVKALPAPCGDLLTIAADVRDADAMRRAVEQTVARFGRLDILVANAGVGHRGALVDADWSDVETVLRTNIDGVLHSIRAAVPAMRSNGSGHIVVISSVVAQLITPYTATYALTKAAVASLARSLRMELADEHITVTDIRLGRTVSEFNQKRLGSPGRSSTSIVPIMSAERAAERIVRAVEAKKKNVTLRLIDRLMLLLNIFAPGIIGKLAMKQYK